MTAPAPRNAGANQVTLATFAAGKDALSERGAVVVPTMIGDEAAEAALTPAALRAVTLNR